MLRWIIALLILLPAILYYVSNWFFASSKEPASTFFAENIVLADDGPYAFFDETDTQLTVKWVCEQQVVIKEQSVSEHILPYCAYQRKIHVRATPQAAVPIRSQASSLAVLSDIHGQYQLMQQLLQANKVVDEQGNWRFADGHLVVIGDVMGRGAQVTEILWWLYQLEQQAEQEGGQLHLLLGNHETMVFYNDLRYVNDKYQQVAAALGTDYSGLFSESSVLGQWLRSKPVLVQINDMLFVHAGLHPDYMALGMSLAEVNEQYRQSFGIAKEQLREVPILHFLYGSLGPLWYRGYFREENAISETLLDQLLQTLQVRRIVVGHTSMDGVFSHFSGRVISVDSNIKRGRRGEILFWEQGALSRGTLEGERLPLVALPNH
ncbi:metallophosphoesterase [Alishewanella sp. d11]|uniref:metallophosphoesterase n=1 Tax=Alishewanella sp. d11 TaxID=3414030 RepID=UPI003BF7F7E1